ncbi:formate dehydrogenase subunit gamma [Pseudoduganella chitinolytica]|uniref:Formate dehydrogenase subunit gamma n=1 Tax=Pseudoduganella chitinolytica TaxID=34070 RepID=A0ABY8BH14_9BURK|nr:formate dehydrogenase subunit gamma [Pseudoduganella chitinolytica]WEF35189.1 formate dehydrogenase subunit gamma [Pseudoduganella chitinolytica]
MQRWLAMLALCCATLGTGSALAQPEAGANQAAPASTPVPAPAPASAAAPQVQSVDILKQDQAERTRAQPGNAAPVWRAVNAGTEHYSSLPYREAGVLIQQKVQYPGQAHPVSAGEAWRRFRNGPLLHVGGWLFLAAIAACTALYFVAGPLKIKGPLTGRLIERFTPGERLIHWSVAITFVILMLSGLTMAFGKFVLMPLIGHGLFGWLTYALKTVHNFVGPLFAVSLVCMIVKFARDNLPAKADVKWLLSLGGAIGGKHPHAGRFNGGEKIWFWGGVLAMGVLVTASGFVLDKIVPGLDYTRQLMQLSNVVHLVAASLVMAASLGHIYLGTVGMQGAYRAMRDGYVDDQWAKEHHDLWYDDVVRGDVPRVRSQETPPTTATPRTV